MSGARLPFAWTRHPTLVWLALPGILFFLVFHYLPMAGALLAFKDFNAGLGFFGSPWVGLGNFRQLFSSPEFLGALRNTLLISILKLFFGFLAPITLAILLNELRWLRVKKFVQTVTYVPYLLSWVILGGIFLLLFEQGGPVNQLILKFGASPISFLSDDVWFIVLLVVTHIWQSAGYSAVIYLAALSGISPELYEAARVDGANRWQRIRHVTLPGLAPTIIVLLILSLGQILSAGFDQIYNLSNPLVYDVADIIDTYALRLVLSLELGVSTAADMFKSVIGLVLIVLANLSARRISNGEHSVW